MRNWGLGELSSLLNKVHKLYTHHHEVIERDYTDEEFNDVLKQYRDWTRLFGFLNNPYESYLADELSRYSERTEREHNIDVQLRYVREKLNMNIGVSIQPQRSHFIQQYLGIPVDTIRTVTSFTPTLNLRYRFNRQTNLNVT